MDWIVFGAIWLGTVNYFLRKKPPKPVIIGVPDPENSKMFWLSKPEKTWSDEMRDKLPPFFWGIIVGGLGVLAMLILGR